MWKSSWPRKWEEEIQAEYYQYILELGKQEAKDRSSSEQGACPGVYSSPAQACPCWPEDGGEENGQQGRKIFLKREKVWNDMDETKFAKY